MLHSTENVIQHKIGLLNLAAGRDNVCRACKIMGVSRDMFYRYKQAVETDGVDAPFERNLRAPNLKNRIDATIEQVVIEHTVEQSAHA